MQKKSSSIEDIIALTNKGKKYPILNLIGKDPQKAAILSKLVKVRDHNPVGMNKDGMNINQGSLTEISNSIKERVTDAENMMQMFPDLELSAQILISSIISPKDMMNTIIHYKIKNNFLPSELTSTLLNKIEEELEVNYEIKKELPDILKNMLFKRGSHIKAIIPESSVDRLINSDMVVSTESFTEIFSKRGTETVVKNIGILGSNKPVPTPKMASNMSMEAFNTSTIPISIDDKINFSLESFDKPSTNKTKQNNIEINVSTNYGDYVTVSDNFNLLKMPKVIESNSKNKIKSTIRNFSASTENYNTNTSLPELEQSLYRSNSKGMTPFVKIHDQQDNIRKSIGRPLILELPSECFIPIHVPGNEKKHIGGLILIDMDGNPISKNNSDKYSNNLQAGLNDSQNSMSSFLLQRSKNTLNGPNDSSTLTVEQATKIYSEVIEDDLMHRLKNGKYGTKLAISKSEDIYRIMLGRTFANQYTKLVFIPIELFTYFAHKFNKNGVGKTLLDDMRILISISAMTTVARVIGSLKNSIGVTEVKIKFDENDPDPEKTAEIAIHEILKTRLQQAIPLNITSAPDIVDYVQRSGLEFSFEGHPRMPDMNFEFTNKANSVTLPDNDLDESLRKSRIQAIGLSPETVDNGFAAEFATTVVSNNILLSKRVLQHQETIEPLLADFAKKVITNDNIIKDNLIKIIKDKKDSIMDSLTDEEKTIFADKQDSDELYNYILDKFIDRLELTLPKPSSTTINTQITDATAYIEALDKFLNEAYISEDIFNESYSGNIAGSIASIKAVVKAGFIRQYLADNNIMPELSDLVSKDEDGAPKMDIYKLQSEHANSIIASSIGFINAMSKMAIAANKDLDKIEASKSGDEGGGDSDYNPTADNGGGDSKGEGEPKEDDKEDDGLGDMDGL